MKRQITIFILILIFGYLWIYGPRDFTKTKVFFSLNEKYIKSLKKKVYIFRKYNSQKEVNCPSGSISIAYFGQSNSSNFVRPKASIELPKNLFQYDWKKKKCYKYKEPLIGADGFDGNVITYTSAYFASESKIPIIIIPFGLGGSKVQQWSDGNLAERQIEALSSIKTKNLNPYVFLWHQGESDRLTTKDEYKNGLQIVINRVKQEFPNSFFGVALVSRCKRGFYPSIIQAQKEIIKINKKVFLSADSDIINGSDDRYDNCHFSDKGAQKLGKAYYDSIKLLFQNFQKK